MRAKDIYNNVCGRINEIDKLLQVTISWSRVMQLNPDTTINGENGDSISEKWETMAKGIKDLAEDIDTLKQEEMLQAADMIAELRKKFRIIEKRKNKRTKAFDIYIERETSHEIREQKCHIHDYWQYIYEDMQLVIDTLYDTQRSRYGATPLPTAEEPLPLAANGETPLRLLIGKEVDKYLRFCEEKREYKDSRGKAHPLQDSKKIRLLKYIGKDTIDTIQDKKVATYLKTKGKRLYDLHEELRQAGVIKCKQSSFNNSIDMMIDDALKRVWDSYN